MKTREERFYDLAFAEIEENRPARAIWAKAFAASMGDEPQTKALYLRLRVEQLERDYQESIADRLLLSRAAIESRKPFTCPYCEERTNARVTERSFVTGPARYRYYCTACGTELCLSGPPAKAPSARPPAGGKRDHPVVVAGFVLGLVSMVLYVIGIIPVLAVVLSGIGQAGFNPEVHRNRWMGVAGLVLGIDFTVVMLAHYKHI